MKTANLFLYLLLLATQIVIIYAVIYMGGIAYGGIATGLESGGAIVMNAAFIAVCWAVILLNYNSITTDMGGIAKVMAVFYGYILFASVFSFTEGGMRAVRALVAPMYPFGAFFAYYALAKSGLIGEKTILLGQNIILLSAIALFGSIYKYLSLTSSGYVNVYFIFFPMMWCMLLRSRLLQLVIFFAVGIVAVYTNKRGVMLAFGATVLIFYAVKNFFIEKKFRLLFFIAMPFVLAAIGYTLYNVSGGIDSSLYTRFSNISVDGGSGRSYIWSAIIDAYFENPVLWQIFGSGYYGVINLMRGAVVGAHNDYLEALYNYGIVGFGSIIAMFVLLLKKSVSLISKKSFYAPALCGMFGAYVILTNISIVYFIMYYSMLLFGFMGYLVGKIDLEEASDLRSRNAFYPNQNFRW